jgi:hypothetical protein
MTRTYPRAPFSYAAASRASRAWLVPLARLGHAVKGVVYILIGFLAFRASQTGRGPDGKEGAVREIGQQPFGDVWLVLAGVGLAGYTLWRLVQALFDSEGEGRSLVGIAKRIGYAASGIVHGAVAVAAFQFALGSEPGHARTARTWISKLLEQPFGELVLVAIGIGIVITGIAELGKALTASFEREVETFRMKSDEQRWMRVFGRLGHAAQGVVLPIIGIMVIRAALDYDPSKAKGLGGALRVLQVEYGPVLLAVVAFGLAAHGVFTLICAKYRRIRTP